MKAHPWQESMNYQPLTLGCFFSMKRARNKDIQSRISKKRQRMMKEQNIQKELDTNQVGTTQQKSRIFNYNKGVKEKSKTNMKELFVYCYLISMTGGCSILQSQSVNMKGTRQVVLVTYQKNVGFSYSGNLNRQTNRDDLLTTGAPNLRVCSGRMSFHPPQTLGVPLT